MRITLENNHGDWVYDGHVEGVSGKPKSPKYRKVFKYPTLKARQKIKDEIAAKCVLLLREKVVRVFKGGVLI